MFIIYHFLGYSASPLVRKEKNKIYNVLLQSCSTNAEHSIPQNNKVTNPQWLKLYLASIYCQVYINLLSLRMV